jgi:hypothetical protein
VGLTLIPSLFSARVHFKTQMYMKNELFPNDKDKKQGQPALYKLSQIEDIPLCNF